LLFIKILTVPTISHSLSVSTLWVCISILERKPLIRIVGSDGVHPAVLLFSVVSPFERCNSVDAMKKFDHWLRKSISALWSVYVPVCVCVCL
jgi:hypothetical protein